MFLDDLIADGRMSELELSLANRAVVVRAQNVADYIFAEPDRKWSIRDFPNIASPAPILWMEWKHQYLEGETSLTSILICTYDFEEYKKHEPTPEWTLKLDMANTTIPRWICVAQVFGRSLDTGQFLGYIGCRWAVGPGGEAMADGVAIECSPDAPSRADEIAMSLLAVPWLTLSFMHCKNVELVKGPAIPERLQKARISRGRRPLVRWHVLNIEPVKRIVDVAHGKRIEWLTPAALHICRGHFKDFTQHGLFGKLHGVYWWPMHARGDADSGRVLKDYQPLPKEA